MPADKREDADLILLGAAAGGADLGALAGLAEEMYRRSCPPDRDDDGFDDRSLRLDRTFRGAGRLDGDLTSACTAALTAVIEALGQKAGPEDTRTARQRHHDALEEACTRLIASGMLPERAGQPTVVQLHMTLRELRGSADSRSRMPGPPHGRPGPAAQPTCPTHPGPAAQPTSHAGPGGETAPAGEAARGSQAARAAAEGQPGWLTGRAAHAYACDAAITPIVTGTLDHAALAALAAEIRATGTGPPGHPQPPGPAARARLHEILLRHAAAVLSGPGGLAAFLRTRLTGGQVPVGQPAAGHRHPHQPDHRRAAPRRHHPRPALRLPRLRHPTRRLPGPPPHPQSPAAAKPAWPTWSCSAPSTTSSPCTNGAGPSPCTPTGPPPRSARTAPAPCTATAHLSQAA